MLSSCRKWSLAAALLAAGAASAHAQVVFERASVTADQPGHTQAVDSNDGLIVAGFLSDVAGIQSGSAAVYDATSGDRLFALIPSDPAAFDRFGNAVCIGHGLIAVGANRDDDNGMDSGSAYVFDGSTGQQLFKLLPDDGSAGDWFGRSVAIAEGLIIVGASRDGSGSVYLFDATTGQQTAKLTPQTAGDASSSGFGLSIATDGTYIAVSAYGDDQVSTNAGAIYVFDTAGQFVRKLLPPIAMGGGELGLSVDIDEGTIVGGAWRASAGGYGGVGLALVFDAPSGQLLHTLAALDPKQGALFGYSVGIRGETVIVGAESDTDQGDRSGSAYLFDTTTGEQLAKLFPSDGGPIEYFGIDADVGADGGIVVASARGDGVFYTYDPPLTNCVADLVDPAGRVLNFADISAFLAYYNAGDPRADFSGPYLAFNFFDVSRFLDRFLAGCP